ncbi:MAG: hypothetical protein ABI317_10045 [Gaiellales bacterium]
MTCGSGPLNGETFIDCGIVGVHGQPKAGSYVARPGDVIVLPTLQKISCSVRSLTSITTIFCYHVDKRGIVKPGSYSFGLSDVVTTTLAWLSTWKSKLVGHWAENG